MKIELIDSNTIKVTLNDKDMYRLSINYSEMDYSEVATKRAIKSILNEIKSSFSFPANASKLFIEAFPNNNSVDGCILYISFIEKGAHNTKHELSTPLVIKIDDINTLSILCKRIFHHYSHLILKSSLYLMDNHYMLVVHTYSKLDKKISTLAHEYAELYGKGKIAGSFIKEHSSPLITENAIETIVETIC